MLMGCGGKVETNGMEEAAEYEAWVVGRNSFGSTLAFQSRTFWRFDS